MIGRGVWGHLPEEKVWGGQVHERHERECWGSEGHRALVEVKSYKLFRKLFYIYKGQKSHAKASEAKNPQKGGKKADGLKKPARLLRITKQSSHTLANLHSDGGTQEGRTIGRSPGRLGEKGGGEEMVTATGYLLEEVVGLTAEGTKGADYKGDYSHFFLRFLVFFTSNRHYNNVATYY